MNALPHRIMKTRAVARDLPKAGLVDLQRLAYLLKSLSPEELETLELLLDDEATTVIQASFKELQAGKSIPLHDW